MDIRVLRYFLAVAREETINGAASFLHVSQPTLSRQLMDLEEELGSKLFLRGNRRVTLTEEGLFLRKRAQEIVDLFDKTEAEFHEPEEIIGGEIFIGGGETEAIRLVARIAKQFAYEHPQVRYHLYSGNADDVTDRLDKGLLDFGILIEPVDVSKYDFVHLPAKDVWGLLMRRDNPLSTKDAIAAADLMDIPLLISRQSMVHSVFSKWLGNDVSLLNVVASYNLIYNASVMVDEGVGSALTLDRIVNTSGDSNLCFRPLSPQLDAGLVVVWKKYQVFSRAAEKFLEQLRTAFDGAHA